jgi:maleylpyruvate isomerase
MSETAEDAARAALRERLGAGARYDSAAAPARELLWARRGTAYFARKLNELRDAELDAPTLVPGWTRRHLIAHVGYNARALCRLVEGARTGVEMPMYVSTEQRQAEIDLGSTLPPRALRNLFDHAAVHLSVEWRDLFDEGWDVQVRTLDRRIIPVRETAWIRSREVWVHAVDLDNGGSFLDFPPDLLDALLADVLRTWAERSENVNLVLAATDRPQPIKVGAGTGPTITGKTADLARWLTGRGARYLASSTGVLPGNPRWL